MTRVMAALELMELETLLTLTKIVRSVRRDERRAGDTSGVRISLIS